MKVLNLQWLGHKEKGHFFFKFENNSLQFLTRNIYDYLKKYILIRILLL